VVGSVYEINAPEMLEEPKSESNYLLSVLTQSWLFFKYAGLWLLPNPRWMSADMREYFAASIDYFHMVSFAAFFGWGAVAVRLLFKRGRLGLFGFAMLFPWLLFMTEFSTIRIQEIFVLYRSYLWAAGGCIAVALLLDYFDKRLARVVIVATAIAMVPVSLDRLASFSLPVLLWTDAEKLVHDRLDAPGAYRIYYNLGTEYVKLDFLDVGMAYFEKAVKIKPDWPFTYNNMGVVYLKTGQWNKAIESFNRSIELVSEKHGGKTYARSFFGRATAHEQMGNLMAAQADYSVSCKFEGKGCEKLAQ
jgi:tetratricopeptide (TPR) repeat protein